MEMKTIGNGIRVVSVNISDDDVKSLMNLIDTKGIRTDSYENIHNQPYNVINGDRILCTAYATAEEDSEYKDFKEMILDVVHDNFSGTYKFARQLPISGQKYSYDDYVHYHDHTADLSSIFYITVDETNPAILHFRDEDIYYEPKEKEIVFFDSHLPHGVLPADNSEDYKRYCIVMNFEKERNK